MSHEDDVGMEGESKNSENEDTSKKGGLLSKPAELAFLTGVAGASILFGFGLTLTMSKKKDPNMFNKGLIGSIGVPESGGALALRALGLGTLYAVTGFSLFCFGTWKLMGVHSMEEFRNKVRSVVPQVPKSEPQGRSDFKSVRELVNYITDESKVSKKKD